MEDSPARTSASQAREPGWLGNVPAFGGGSPVPFASFDPDSLSWKTLQLSLLEDSETFSQTWPRAGMTQSGIAYQRQPSVPLTDVIASSSLPTPSATDYGSNQSPSDGAAVRLSLTSMARQARWPTPRVSATRTSRKAIMGSSSAPSIEQAIELSEGILPREIDNLDEAPPSWRALWPTPLARDARTFKGAKRAPNSQGAEPLVVQVGGTLNPTWVAWLQGFPLDWTEVD